MPSYDLVMYRGSWNLYWKDENGDSRRRSLGTTDRDTAGSLKREIEAVEERVAAATFTVAQLWDRYLQHLAGRPIARRMPSEWKALEPTFGALLPHQITETLCKAYAARRRAEGRKDSTILGELNRVASALHFSQKRGLIEKLPVMWFPRRPPPKDHHLTREQVRAMVDGAKLPHVALFIILAITTGARMTAILELTWDRVDMACRRINLQTSGADRPMKGRAVVPINDTAFEALAAAKTRARSDFVVEYAGGKVLSVKKGLANAAARAGIGFPVGAHIFRHSAAVWMAEAGASMPSIAQYLGHSNSRITEEVYARFTPKFLEQNAAALEL